MVGDRLSLIVAGGMASMPFAGVAWQVLSYLEGFRRLGHDVFYLEDTGRWPYDPELDTVSDDSAAAVRYTAAMMRRVGLEDAWGYRDVVTGSLHGATEDGLAARLAAADALLNVSGVTVLTEAHLAVPVRIYLESDPVLAQIEVAKGNQRTIDWLAAHTHHFTFGENFGAPDCTVPTERFRYIPTRQPVVLDWWHPPPADLVPRREFTTVASWKQTNKDIEWRGELLTWSKDVQFMEYIALPQLVARPLELALAIDDDLMVERLRSAGWSVVPALPMTKDIDDYRRYLQSSAGEFSVAKVQYVKPRSGWFSDRTAAYLACGKPAIVQDSAFALPRGEGLFGFDDLEGVLSAFEAIDSDYERHSRAAREIAYEYLRAETVLARLLADAELG